MDEHTPDNVREPSSLCGRSWQAGSHDCDLSDLRRDVTQLTPWQKLEALSLRFYSKLAWSPKAGDHYTTSRADLELYQVVDIREGRVFTRYCDPQKSTELSTWPEAEFLSPDTFGYARVFVHEVCLRPNLQDIHAKERAEAQGRLDGLCEAARLSTSVYMDLIGQPALCPCGNGRVPTGAYRKATEAYAVAIDGLMHRSSNERQP